jgi:hypothetical protein
VMRVPFWDRTRTVGECLEWTGGRSGDGYGAVVIDGRQTGAHRHAWAVANGPIPHGLQVLHTCDNPICILPAHLFLGTVADNMADKARKLRSSIGVRNPKAKLTPAAVIEIRRLDADGWGTVAIATKFGVGRVAIRRIVRRVTWVHV